MHQHLFFLILLIVLLTKSKRQQSPLTSTKCSADPLFSVEDLFRKPGSFTDIFHLKPVTFITEICAELKPSISLQRAYLLRDDYAALGFVSKLRKCQINDINRILRYILATRKVSFPLLSMLFDQSTATTYKDFHHIAILFVDELADKIIKQIIPNSAEYYELIGNGCFRHFPRCILSVDIIKVCVFILFLLKIL